MFNNDFTVLVTFAATIIVTFSLAYIGGKHSQKSNENDLAGRNLNGWLVGLSAGATANSGFIVSGAIGLGYLYGLQWVLLPIAWLIGDLVFWKYFPKKINAVSHDKNLMTLPDILTSGENKKSKTLSILTALVLIFGVGGYLVAQWSAGQKFVTGAFELSSFEGLLIFALLIVGYSAIGKFRGSVYVDTFQAILRLVGCALIFIFLVSNIQEAQNYSAAYADLDESYFSLFGSMGLLTACGFILGWAGASLGFGLGQPQVVMRYMAARNEHEIKKAKWIYIAYVQITWISMTIFGIALRGLMPEIEDPEAGLAEFVSAFMPPILAGIIIADIFGVIASTANSLLVAVAHSIKHDLLKNKADNHVFSSTFIYLCVGLATMFIAYKASSTVAAIAIASISFIAAGLAGPMMIKLLNLRNNQTSLWLSMLLAVLGAVLWSQFGLSSFINEAIIGVCIALIVNRTTCYFIESKGVSDGHATTNQ